MHTRRHIKQLWLTFLPTAGAVMMGLLVIMMFTGQWPTRDNLYNSYVLQAQCWLEGRLALDYNRPWLELAIYEGQYFVSFPPFPSYVMLPFVAIWGTNAPDAFVSLAFTLMGVWYAVRLCLDQRISPGRTMFWVSFLFLGTGYVFIAMNGYVWFLAQAMCFALSLMALWHAARGHGVVSLSAWACAVGCRPMVILYLPVLAILLWRRQKELEPGRSFWHWVLKRWYWCLGPLIIGGSYMVLNYLRFDNPIEFGHNYLPEFTRVETGQFNLSYLPENLRSLIRLPQWYGSDLPMSFEILNGMAFYLVNPLIVVALAAWVYGLIRNRRAPLLITLIPLTLVYVFILCLHKTMGGWHFGNRYLLDITPWLFAGLVYWQDRKPLITMLAVPCAAFGILLNVVGTVATYNGWL